jgi:probable rRNA maturation factor
MSFLKTDKTRTSVMTNLRRYAVSTPKVRAMALTLAQHLNVSSYSLDVTFVGKRRMRALNSTYRQKERSTDVLSFGLVEWQRPRAVFSSPRIEGPVAGPPQHLGDIVISLEDAEKNARTIGQPLDREVCFLLIHGILHLCGHDHERPQDEQRMRRASRRLLAIVSGDRRQPMWHQCVRVRA